MTRYRTAEPTSVPLEVGPSTPSYASRESNAFAAKALESHAKIDQSGNATAL
jgi:hypothetical protein